MFYIYSQGLKLLEYLTNYKRTADPSEYERNYQPVSEEREMLCGDRILSQASRHRLPFHPFLFGNAWKIICKYYRHNVINSMYSNVTRSVPIGTEKSTEYLTLFGIFIFDPKDYVHKIATETQRNIKK